MYKQNKSLHKINLWIILQYVKQNTISNTIPLKVLATLFYNNVQMYVVFSIFYILIMMFPCVLSYKLVSWFHVSKSVEKFFIYTKSTARNEDSKIKSSTGFSKAKFSPHSGYLLEIQQSIIWNATMVLYCIKALTCLLIIYISLINCDAKIQWKMLFSSRWVTRTVS